VGCSKILDPEKTGRFFATLSTHGRIFGRNSSGAEFGNLTNAFNKMAKDVSEGKLLSKFVSQSVRTAAKSKERGIAAQKGEFVQVTVVFAGLVDFKGLLSKTAPDTLVVLLNRYLESMSKIIRNYGGDIDKFIGDKILGVFHPSDLGSDEAAALAAVKAAEEMCLKMDDLRSLLPKPLGVGIVTGPVLAGIMGTPDVRLEYTVIGDTVNLASRLGDLALKLDPHGNVLTDYTDSVGGVVLAGSTFELLKTSSDSDLTRRMQQLILPPIKGKTREVEAWHLPLR